MSLQEKFEILKAKIERIVKSKNGPRVDFLGVITSHDGSVIKDSISFSFHRYKEKYGNKKFEEVLKDFKEDGIITEKYGLSFSVFDEKGEFDYKAAEELARFTGKLIFESNPRIKQVIDEILQEPEGNELLKFIAKEKGVNIVDGQEPKIVQLIGKRTYKMFIDKLVRNNILVEYAWSSRKHGYSGYKLLPFVDYYIKNNLGIVELTNSEKIVLSYIESFSEAFSEPLHWYLWFNYPNEHDHKILNICHLHKKFLASLIDTTEEDIQRIIEKLKKKNLLTEVDLGYTRGGSHRGIILQLSDAGQKLASSFKEKLKDKINNKVKEIFSNVENRATYYLFCQERIPLNLLSLVRKENVRLLFEVGLISDKQDVFLAFKEGTWCYDYINSGISPERVREKLKEECATILSEKEKLFLGFISGCKNVILGKHVDWKAWSSVTSRTQRKYERAYETLIVNFPYLKKLFSYLTGLPIEEIDKITSNLENKGFLIQEETYCHFPGHVLIYRIPVKFDFEINTDALKLKIKNYIEFLVKDVKNYNQLIFLDYLIRLYDIRQCDFLVNTSFIKDFLDLLSYEPPSRYLPIYAFEDEVILIHPWVKEELKREIFKIKSKLIEPIKNTLLELTKDYQRNISYNFLGKNMKEGYFIVEIESPDPSVGTVSFIVTPWVSSFDIHEINITCTKSNTINLLTFYPNYPSLKSMTKGVNGRYNLAIIRDKTIHLYFKKADQITQTILTGLSKEYTLVKEEEKVKKEVEELMEDMEKYPNLVRVRYILPEAETLLKNAIRPRLKKEFGINWEDKIRQRFPKAEKRKQRWEKEHPGEKSDILQGLSLGDLKTLLEDKSFSFLKDCFKDLGLVKASINVFLKRKEYHHGKPANGKDIPKEEVEVIITAYTTLQKMINLSI